MKRKSDDKDVTVFRTDRYFLSDGKWFFTTREGTNLGPVRHPRRRRTCADATFVGYGNQTGQLMEYTRGHQLMRFVTLPDRWCGRHGPRLLHGSQPCGATGVTTTLPGRTRRGNSAEAVRLDRRRRNVAEGNRRARR